MKKSLADRIESYLKVLIDRSDSNRIEIQRAELAETFACVPSQVTYVLATRFGQKDGYLTESRRGGKGYVRITRLAAWIGDEQGVGCDLERLIKQMYDNHQLDDNQYRLIRHICTSILADLPDEQQQPVAEGLVKALTIYIGWQQ